MGRLRTQHGLGASGGARRRLARAAGVCVAGVLAVALAGCAVATEESRRETPPPAQASDSAASPPAATGTAAASPAVTPPAVTRPALAPAAQAELDQQLVRAAKANDVAAVTRLIQAGGNVDAKDAIQDSAFLYAGAEGFNEVLQLTLANGADVASTNRFGGTALIPASEHGHVDTVRILLAAGVPVNNVNNLGWTALQEAILLNDGGPRQQEVVRQLLDAGADPDIRDPQGRTALENAERLGFGAIAKLIRER
ncbi:ankyrin repeat domain-containing protein [Arthrobacter sp. YAF17]